MFAFLRCNKRKKRKQHRHSKKRIICAVSSLVYICLLLLLLLLLLHCALASGAMHWNRSCLFVLCLCLCVFVAVTTITRNCMIDLHQTGSVGEGSDHLQLIKFWPSCARGKGVCGGRKFLAPPYYSQRAVFASLRSLFITLVCYLFCCYHILW